MVFSKQAVSRCYKQGQLAVQFSWLSTVIVQLRRKSMDLVGELVNHCGLVIMLLTEADS
jgi:hypothetical protein